MEEERRELRQPQVLVPATPTRPPRVDELFAGGDPSAILSRLNSGDPLDLEGRSARRLRERALLLDVDRVRVHVLARVAALAHKCTGDPPHSAWLTACIDAAIDSILTADREQERAGLLPEHDDRPHAILAAVFGIDPRLARAASVAFHGLPDQYRRSFFALAIEGRSVEDCIAAGLGKREHLRSHVRAGFQALGLLDLARPARVSSPEKAPE